MWSRGAPFSPSYWRSKSYDELTRIEQHWDTHGFGPWALDVRGDFT